MSIDSQNPGSGTEPRAPMKGTSDTHVERNAQERADVEEDRRRQRELDDAELGGEA